MNGYVRVMTYYARIMLYECKLALTHPCTLHLTSQTKEFFKRE